MATFQIQTSSSTLQWTGKKVLGLHTGSIQIAGGHLQFINNQISGGEIEVDMSSIVITDIPDPETNQTFLAHLRHEDFFAVESYPISHLSVQRSVHVEKNRHRIEGHLTIKNLRHPVSFYADIEIFNDTLHATGELVIDRTLYNMRYGSGKFLDNLGDKLIYDEFSLQFKLIAQQNN